MKKILLILVIAFIGCSIEKPTQFSEKALNDKLITQSGKTNPFKEIIDQYKGKKVLIDIWASWCGDCIKGLPSVVELQKAHKDVVYLFLSLDKTPQEWKEGINKYNITGEHYLLQSGWKGDFGNFVSLDWVPRYLVIDENGKIVLFKAIHADDENVIEALK